MRHRGKASQPEQSDTVDNEVADNVDIDIVSADLVDEADIGAGHESQAQEVIRVRSDLLDNLVNSAGEVSIYRARMEQHRLKNQLRSLEAETDAQIHFSHRVNTETAGDFDPLEMDRYTLIQELSRSLSESVNDLSTCCYSSHVLIPICRMD